MSEERKTYMYLGLLVLGMCLPYHGSFICAVVACAVLNQGVIL